MSTEAEVITYFNAEEATRKKRSHGSGDKTRSKHRSRDTEAEAEATPKAESGEKRRSHRSERSERSGESSERRSRRREEVTSEEAPAAAAAAAPVAETTAATAAPAADHDVEAVVAPVRAAKGKFPCLRTAEQMPDDDALFAEAAVLIRRSAVSTDTPAAGEGATEGQGGEIDPATNLLTYDYMLERIFALMTRGGVQRGPAARVPQPVVERFAKKKCIWKNFMRICQVLHRHPEHMKEFICAELNTTGHIDGKDQLVLKQRFVAKRIEGVLRRYIDNYIRCSTCASLDTLLFRDSKMPTIQCERCGAHKTVQKLKTAK